MISSNRAIGTQKRSSFLSDSSEFTSTSELDVTALKWESVAIVGRATETELIKESLGCVRTDDARARAILVHGTSGTGKSALVTAVVQEEVEKYRNAILWVTGKFDQNVDTSTPLRAAIDAATELCRAIHGSKKSAIIKSDIKAVLRDDDLQILNSVVPAITMLFPHLAGNDTEKSAQPNMSESGSIRFMMIFRKFLNASCSAERPLVLFLDDLQWADDLSYKLVVSIMKDPTMTNILLLGAVRDGEATTFEAPSDSVITVTKITCANFDEQHVFEIVAKATGTDANDAHVQELGALVHSRTQGNPYFVTQLMDSLVRIGIMKHNVATDKFEWDCSVVANNTDPSADVVEFMIQSIYKLPYNSRLILVIAATLGHTFKTEVLEILLSSVDLLSLLSTSRIKNSDQDSASEAPVDMLSDSDVKLAIKQACKAKLINSTSIKNQYRFSHDRVQQGAMAIMPDGEEGKSIKSTIGTLMLELSKSSNAEDWMLYSACNLLTQCGSDELVPSEIADLSLRAARKAASQAAFKSAAEYADGGVAIIGKAGWISQYSLCLDLSNISAEAHYASGNFTMSKRTIKSIEKRVTKKEDTFRAHHVLLDILSAADDFVGSVQEGLRGLREIGVRGPENPGKIGIIRNLIKAKRLLRGRTPAELKTLPRMTDSTITEATLLLSVVAAAGFMCGDDDRCVMACLQMFQLTLQYGISAQGPFSIAAFGFVLSHIGEVELAQQFGLAALEVSKRPGMEISVSKTNNICQSCLWHLKKPIRDCPDALLKSSNVGLNNGDPLQGFINLRMSASYRIFVTASLRKFEPEMEKICSSLKEYKQKGQLAVLLPWAQFIENIRGKTKDSMALIGSYMDEREIVRKFENGKNVVLNRHSVLVTHYARLMLFYVCARYQEAEQDRRKYGKLEGEPGTYYHKLFYFCFAALNCYALAISTNRKSYIAKAQKYVKMIKLYGKAGSPNTPPMLALLKAERLTFEGRTLDAALLYVEAISALRKSEFYLLEAVAYERAGLSLKTIDHANSLKCLEEACRKYGEFGADVKVSQMQELYGMK